MTAPAHLARGEEARLRGEYARAGEEFETARTLFEKEGNSEGRIRAWIGVASVMERQGRYDAALDELNAALAAARERLGPGHPEVAHGLEEIATLHESTGRNREAVELCAQALELRRAAKSAPQDVAETLRLMATAHSALGEDDQALARLEQAEAMLRAAVGDRHPDLADVLIGKGAALWGQGRNDQAIEAHEQAIEIVGTDESGRRRGQLAAAYLNMGNIYWSKSDYDETRSYYEKALALMVAAYGETHLRVGRTHFNLAIVHYAMRDFEACIRSAERALGIFTSALGERNPDIVSTYSVLGSALTGKGEPDRALGVLGKALALQRSLPDAGDRDTAGIYTALAEAYRAKRDLRRAAQHCRQALAVDQALRGERHPDVAQDLNFLGDLSLERGDEEEALRLYGRSIAANDPGRSGTDLDLDPPLDTAFSEDILLEALQGAARARGRRGRERNERPELERAALVYAHAARLIDRMRAGYRAEGSKLTIAGVATETYDEAIRTELELHRLTGDERRMEGAFRYAEKAKAGVLRDALNEAAARSFAGLPGPLLDEERRLRLDLVSLDHRLTEAQLGSEVDPGRLQALRDQQFARSREYEALQARFEKEYPSYYDLKYRFETASSAEVGEQALDEGTVLVEYFLGREHVFVFTLTPGGLEVMKVAREPGLEADVSELRRAISAHDFAAYAGTAHRLYRQLLAPVEGQLTGKDLILVPDGPLSTVPFEALLERDVHSLPPDARELPYVLRDHTVSYAYSATVLLQGLRRKGKSPTDELLAFAPVFAEGKGPGPDAPRPLPGSQKEVTDVRALFARRQGLFGGWLSARSRVYLGPDATESRLKSADLERYRYVHLATHGIVDQEHPALSRLLLMPEAGSGEDGVLHLGEIYDLNLNADLVVLSACDTGRGRVARGEGIIGLTRGFLYAGARSLLVSLWPVSDTAASELVVDFYRELLLGRPKARALREAKLRVMSRNPEYAKPYYWSSLVLVGDRR